MKRAAIPYLLTLGNVMAGTAALGVIITDGPLAHAALCVALGLLFDLLDGRAARKLGVSGPFGAQLDSLADVITFGLAPAAVLYAWKLTALGPLGLIAPAALVAAAATRLARFTAAAGGPPTPGPARFRGLAVTFPAAIILGATVADLPIAPHHAALGALLLAALMVSTLPYRSFKDRSVAWVLVPVGLLTVGCALYTQHIATGLGLALAFGGTVYAASAPLLGVVRRVRAQG